MGNRLTDDEQILQQNAVCDRKPCGRLKFAYFKNPRWRTAAILKIENLQ